MATEIKMPQLGLTMTEGTISSWLKKVGDKVKKGDPLVEITTDKLNNILESEVDGFLISINAPEGVDVPVMGVLGYIGAEGESAPNNDTADQTAPNTQETIEKISEAPDMEQSSNTPINTDGRRIKISPLAKKTAQKMNIDFTAIKGSGPGGRIVQKDILSANIFSPEPIIKKPAAQDSGPLKRQKLSSMRKTVGQRMHVSHTEIPSVTITGKIDVTALLDLRMQINRNRSKENKISFNDIIIKAAAKVLMTHKELLESLDGDEIVFNEDINIGMAVALDAGLIAPVIFNADKMTLDAISAKTKDLIRRARDGKLQVWEYQGSTFSISNLGMYEGVESFTSIINQPNSAILGVGAAITELGIDDNGEIVKKKFIRAAATIDHRLLDGADAAKFVSALKKLLENPIEILV